MSIFNVEGWDLPKNIAVAASKEKQRRDEKKKAKKEFEQQLRASRDEEKQEEVSEPQPEKKRKLSVDEDGFTEVKSKKKPKKSKKSEEVEEPKVEEPQIEEPQVEKPKAEEPKAEEPKVETDDSTPKKKSKKEKKEKKQKKVAEPVKAAEPGAPAAPAPPKQKLTALQQKMLEKLSGSRFRWINEQLYTTSSEEAVRIIKEQPEMFDEYHAGFRSQMKSWPQNPVNEFVKQVIWRMQKPIGAPGGMPGERDGTITFADMGCGEANLALDLAKYQEDLEKDEKKRLRKKSFAKPQKLPKFVVHSFDLKKANDRITVADIKNVPLEDESVNVVVFCLALMGTNFLDFIKEGLRILKPNGEIWISEIKSRFVDSDTKEFVAILKSLGLFHKSTDDTNKMFIRFEFFKPNKQYIEERAEKEKRYKNKRRTFEEAENEEPSLEQRRSKEPEGRWLLKPCIYKRR